MKKKEQMPESRTIKIEDAAETGAPKEESATDAAPATLEEQLAEAQKEARENYDRFLRISAEFENYKKRTEREMADFRKYANEALVKEILPTVDNLERALIAAEENQGDNGNLLEGVRLTLKDMLKIFEKFHVKPIEALGQTFDPNFHQAIQQEQTADHPPNTVTREFQKGYTIHDRLLRPSMVVVAKAQTEENSPFESHENDNNKKLI